MTYQEILDRTVPELEDKHLERYIGAFEAWELSTFHGCAVAHMMREPADQTLAAGYVRYKRSEPFTRGPDGRAIVEPTTPLNRIEIVFEGYRQYVELTGRRGTDKQRRRLIYEACIEEQARRRSAAIAPPLVAVED